MQTTNARLQTENARLQTENTKLKADSKGMARALAKVKAEYEEAWREIDAEREVAAELRCANALLAT